MESDKEVHFKVFGTNMYQTCFNECITTFSTSNLTAKEGKCLKACYTSYSKKLLQST